MGGWVGVWLVALVACFGWLVCLLIGWLLACLVVCLLACSLASLLACLLFWFALLACFDVLSLVDLRGSRH